MADDGLTSGAGDHTPALRKIIGAPARSVGRDGVDFQTVLSGFIDDLLADALAFEDFERRFSDCFIDELRDEDIDVERLDYFSRIHEKLSWTGRDVDEESRRHGWIDIPEFSQWLRSQRAALGGGEPLT